MKIHLVSVNTQKVSSSQTVPKTVPLVADMNDIHSHPGKDVKQEILLFTSVVNSEHLDDTDNIVSPSLDDTRVPNVTRESTVRSRKTRKAAKPTRIDGTVELVSIARATAPMRSKCDACTYTCNTVESVTAHRVECHGPTRSVIKSLVCRICKMSTDEKEVFREHMTHHPGSHAVRQPIKYHSFFCSFSDVLF